MAPCNAKILQKYFYFDIWNHGFKYTALAGDLYPHPAVGLKTADHRRPPQNTLQDAENNFISFQTWFRVKIKH